MNRKKCGFVAIIGEPNSGKSTLINALVGQKIAIMTPKAQTTRSNLRGIITEDNMQMIFIDTPGIFAADHNFEKSMVKSAWSAAAGADIILLMIDATKGITAELQNIIENFKTLSKKPLFALINKLDKVQKIRLIELAEILSSFGIFKEILFASALKKDGITQLKKTLCAILPDGEFHYPEDTASDIELRALAAEITREKLFLIMAHELPYSCLIETEQWNESAKAIAISQVIYVQRETHKKMVIGEKGAMIKRIGSSSRRELEKLLEKNIHLSLFVKLRKNWKNEKTINNH